MKIIALITKFTLVCLVLISLIIFLPISQMSAEQDLKSTLDSYIKTFLESHRIPGASIVIVHENNIFYAKAWG